MKMSFEIGFEEKRRLWQIGGMVAYSIMGRVLLCFRVVLKLHQGRQIYM
jgi:hypothetical protein